MLTISRKSGQRVVVKVFGHQPLVITFLGHTPGRCQLAFDGPMDYGILREELTPHDDHDELLTCHAAGLQPVECDG